MSRRQLGKRNKIGSVNWMKMFALAQESGYSRKLPTNVCGRFRVRFVQRAVQ
jgi:hypothetical protein